MGPLVAIHPVPQAREERAVAVLARAFRDNPLDIAVIRGSAERRLRSIEWGMRSTLAAARRANRSMLLAAHDRDASADPLGVLLALPSSALPLPPAPLLGQLRASVGQGFGALRRWGEVFHVLERQQPAEAHWYLSLVGVDPPQWSNGIGRRLLDAWLQAIDPERLPSYLETDREQNLSFYAASGFEVVAELEILETPVWCMRRPAPARPPATPKSSRGETP